MSDFAALEPRQIRRWPWSLILITLVCAGLEVMFALVEQLGLGPARLRSLIYEYGGFWVGLLRAWTPNYPAQPYTMFVTYGFLHAGLSHLLTNMVVLWVLGLRVLDRVGTRGFWLLYVGSLLGGAVGFAVLASVLAPMVGASGAIFGLAGGLLAWAYVDRYTLQEALWPIAQIALLLLVLNIVMWWARDGQVAWETHLGGFVAGWIIALLIDPRPRMGTDAAP